MKKKVWRRRRKRKTRLENSIYEYVELMEEMVFEVGMVEIKV